MTVTERLFGAGNDGPAAAADDAPPRPEVLNPRAHPAAQEVLPEMQRAEVRVQELRDRREDLQTQKVQLERTTRTGEGDELASALSALDDVERELRELRGELSDAATERKEVAARYRRALDTAAEEIAEELRTFLNHRLSRLANELAEVEALCRETMPAMQAVRDRNLTARRYGPSSGAHPVELPHAAIYKPGFLGGRGPLSSLRKQLREAGYEAD